MPQTCFVIEDFGGKRNGCKYKKWMATPCIESMEEFYFGRTSGLKCCYISKRHQYLIGELDFQNRVFPCFRRFTHPDSFEKKPVGRNIKNNTLKSMPGRSNVSKMWGQGGFVHGTLQVNGKEYNFVRILPTTSCQLTTGKSPSNETSSIRLILFPWAMTFEPEVGP